MNGRAFAVIAATVVALTACTPPGDPEDDSSAVTELSEIGVLADMTASECAVAGSPWRIDDMQFDRDYTLALQATEPEAASGGIAGSYTIDFWSDGRFRLQTSGYNVRTATKTVDESGAFDHITAVAPAGAATAEWGDIDDNTISFIDWSSDVVLGSPTWDDGSAYPGELPAWELQGRPSVALECDEDGTGLWLRATTPGYLDLHFVR